MKKQPRKQRVTELANKLEFIIQEAIKNNSDNKYEYLFQELSEEILRQYRDSKEMIEVYKQEGLTINALEAEGYLRAMATLKNFLEDINPQKND